MDSPHTDGHIYTAARIGDLLHHFSLDQCYRFRTPSGDHVIHLASRFGHHPIVKSALDGGPHALLFQKNARGETPMHLAAEHGHMDIVRLIAEWCAEVENEKEHVVLSVTENGDGDSLKPWKIQTKDNGDIPLHKALRNGHEDIAVYLLGLDKEAPSVVNHSEESPLYLAAENRCDLVMEIIMTLNVDRYSDSGPLGRSPLHAAIRTNRAAVERLCEKRPDLVIKGDHKKKTALHYAAEEGHKKIVRILLESNPDAACSHDKDGFTPLHKAAMAGFHVTVKTILKYAPHSIEFRDGKDGRTTLHLIDMKGKYLRSCLKTSDLIILLNEPDHKGNTPLHLAIMDFDESKALVLLSTKGINWRIRNQNKQTPIDLCISSDEETSKKLRIVHLALKTHEKAWLHKGKTKKFKHKAVKRIDMLRERFRKYKEGDLRQMINNMALVATLIVTLTFAAAFTVPGGYDQTNGKLLLRKKLSFQIFYICNIIALLTSITVIINYPLGAFFAKPDTLSKIAHDMAIRLHICLAVTAMAFIFGVYSVTSRNTVWIACLASIATMSCVGMPLLQNWYWAFKNRGLLKRVGYVAHLGGLGA